MTKKVVHVYHTVRTSIRVDADDDKRAMEIALERLPLEFGDDTMVSSEAIKNEPDGYIHAYAVDAQEVTGFMIDELDENDEYVSVDYDANMEPV